MIEFLPGRNQETKKQPNYAARRRIAVLAGFAIFGAGVSAGLGAPTVAHVVTEMHKSPEQKAQEKLNTLTPATEWTHTVEPREGPASIADLFTTEKDNPENIIYIVQAQEKNGVLQPGQQVEIPKAYIDPASLGAHLYN